MVRIRLNTENIPHYNYYIVISEHTIIPCLIRSSVIGGYVLDNIFWIEGIRPQGTAETIKEAFKNIRNYYVTIPIKIYGTNSFKELMTMYVQNIKE